MRLGTARVLKYVISAVGLLVFGNFLCFFCIKPNLNGLGENGKPAADPFVPTSKEVLHIGLVVQSYSDCRYASLQVKSLLMHRHNPLHLHFLSNTDLIVILKTLINTWHIPHLNTSFYASDEIPDSLMPLRATNILKLWLSALIPAAIYKIVIIDSEVIVESDISALWQEFRTMGKPLGVLPDTYNGKLDTRLMLVNVTAVRDIKLFGSLAQMMEQKAVYRILSSLSITRHCFVHTGALNCAKVLSIPTQKVSHTTLKEFMSYNSYRLQSIDQAAPGETKRSLEWWDWLTSSCSDMKRRLTYRVHPYFIKYSYRPRDTADISLVTQLSFDRIHKLMRLLELWEGPVSAAVYMEELQVLQLMELIHNAPMFQRTNLALHVVYKKGDFLYPINFLRNTAWNYSTTPYVFLNDIDLMPSVDLYSHLKDSLKHTHLGENSVYVVPAFETPIKDLQLPSSKQLLQTYLKAEQVSPFKWQFHQAGHKPTNYSKWFKATEPYEVQWEDWYEPYMVVHHNTTRYDERFSGYGKNKVSHILELHTQHYHFIVLPNVFVIHYPHKPSRDEITFRQTKFLTGAISHNYACNWQIQEEFCRDLVKKYGHAPSCVVPSPTHIHMKVVVVLVLVMGIVYVCHRYTGCCTLPLVPHDL